MYANTHKQEIDQQKQTNIYIYIHTPTHCMHTRIRIALYRKVSVLDATLTDLEAESNPGQPEPTFSKPEGLDLNPKP